MRAQDLLDRLLFLKSAMTEEAWNKARVADERGEEAVDAALEAWGCDEFGKIAAIVIKKEGQDAEGKKAD